MTIQDERTVAALADRLLWLESVVRETRDGMNRLHQRVEQAQAELWELGKRVQDTEQRVAAVEPHLSALTRTDAQVLQLKDVLAGVREQGLGTATRVSDLVRRVEAAEERERQVLNDQAHRVEAVERLAGGVTARVDTIDESVRRMMEALALVRGRADELMRVTEGLEARQARLAEADARAEHEAARTDAELETLRKQDDLLAERLQVYIEMIKRLEGQVGEVASDAALKHDVVEKLELGRVERQRVEERVGRLEAAAENLRDQDQDTLRLTNNLEGRQRGFQERLNNLLAEMAAHRAQVNDQFQRLFQLQERLKKKQIEDLDRELRELRVHAMRAAEERREESGSA